MSGLLPEYEGPFSSLFGGAIDTMIPAHEPLLAEIRKVKVDHLAKGSFREVHGGLTGDHRMSLRLETSTKAIITTDLQGWHLLLWTASEQLVGEQMRGLHP